MVDTSSKTTLTDSFACICHTYACCARISHVAHTESALDGVLPRGLLMLTIAVGIDYNDGDLGRGICAGESRETV